MGKLEKIEKYAAKGKADKLAALAHDSDKSVRLDAVSSLGKLTSNEVSLNTLVGMMDDSDADIRKAVAVALGESRGSYVETQLRYCLSHEKDEQVLEAARNSLEKIKNS